MYDIRYDNRSYAAIIQRRSRVRGQILAPSGPSCGCAIELSFKICVFQVVKSCCYCRHVRMCKSRVQLEAYEIGEIQARVAHERRLL